MGNIKNYKTKAIEMDPCVGFYYKLIVNYELIFIHRIIFAWCVHSVITGIGY